LPGFSITIAGAAHDADYFRTCIAPQVEKLRGMGMHVDVRNEFLPEEALGALFAEHSAIVLPYTRQFAAQSGVAFMALAHETPIIASEVGGLRDLFDEFKIGATFADSSARALSSTIKEFFERKSCDEVAEQLHAARTHYSWASAADVMIAAYGISPARADVPHRIVPSPIFHEPPAFETPAARNKRLHVGG